MVMDLAKCVIYMINIIPEVRTFINKNKLSDT